MNFCNLVWMGEAQEVDETYQVFGMSSETLPSCLRFIEVQGLNLSAHGTVQNEDALREKRFQQLVS